MNILVLSDEERLKEQAVKILLELGHTVTLASSCNQALGRFRELNGKEKIELLLTHLTIARPGIAVPELCGAMRVSKHDLRVWIMAETLAPASIERAAELSAEKVFLKSNLTNELSRLGVIK